MQFISGMRQIYISNLELDIIALDIKKHVQDW